MIRNYFSTVYPLSYPQLQQEPCHVVVGDKTFHYIIEEQRVNQCVCANGHEPHKQWDQPQFEDRWLARKSLKMPLWVALYAKRRTEAAKNRPSFHIQSVMMISRSYLIICKKNLLFKCQQQLETCRRQPHMQRYIFIQSCRDLKNIISSSSWYLLLFRSKKDPDGSKHIIFLGGKEVELLLDARRYLVSQNQIITYNRVAQNNK